MNNQKINPDFSQYRIKHWFPGHMLKSSKEIKANTKLVDFLIIIVDARLPLSSLQSEFIKEFERKQKIIFAFKSDLLPQEDKKQFIEKFKKRDELIYFVDKFSFHKKKLMSILQEQIFPKIRLKFLRPYRAFVVGMPNVGKSTFINTIINKKQLQVANKPGVTMNLQWVKVNESLELLDTPGIMLPKKSDQETELRLALANIIKQSIVGYENIAHYLIYQLHKNKQFDFLQKSYGIKNFSSNTHTLLQKIAEKKNVFNKSHCLDLEKTAQIIISQFNKNLFPKISLEKNF